MKKILQLILVIFFMYSPADAFLIIGSGSAPTGGSITYGYGECRNDTATGIGYFYVPQVSSGVEATPTANGNVTEIKFFNRSLNGNFRLWKGTMSGNDFVFDSYDEIVLVEDLTTYGACITLTAPTDFTAFAVTTSTVFGVYANTNNTLGLSFGSGTGVSNQFYGSNSGDPPYSGNLTLTNGTVRRIELYMTGESTP